MRRNEVRPHAKALPQGLHLLLWLGPGLLWLIAEVGPEILFGPRVGSRYGYTFLWVPFLLHLFMWIILREAARYTIVTGSPLMGAFGKVPGPRQWALWLIFVPQLVQAAIVIAGVAALTGSTLLIALPGGLVGYAAGLILVAALLVVLGRFRWVDRVASAMALVLAVAFLAAAVAVTPSIGQLTSGLVPSVPASLDLYFLLPWFAAVGAGPPAIIWFSYWIATRGYAGGTEQPTSVTELDMDTEKRREHDARIAGWLRLVSLTAAVGAAGGVLINASLLVLGAEVLAPQGITPQGVHVAADLARLLSGVWDQFGKWVFILGAAVALWGTILSHQDGWGRMFADATAHLRSSDGDEQLPEPIDQLGDEVRSAWSSFGFHPAQGEWLRVSYVLVAATAVPLALLLMVPNPVDLLTIGGIIEAVHMPVVVFLTLFVNKSMLPPRFQPGFLSSAGMVAAGGFYTVFSLLFFLHLAGIRIV